MAPETPSVHCPKCGQNIPLNGIGGERTTVSHDCTAGIIGKVYGFDCEETSGCASTGMAPESERAITHDEAMEAAHALIDHFFKNVTTRRPQARIPAEPTDTDVLLTTYIRQQKEKDAPPCPLNESNRTQFESGCSEVVERLVYEHLISPKLTSQVEAILHSWRERRVQELEEALRTILPWVEDGAYEDARQIVEHALAGSK